MFTMTHGPRILVCFSRSCSRPSTAKSIKSIDYPSNTSQVNTSSKSMDLQGPPHASSSLSANTQARSSSHLSRSRRLIYRESVRIFSPTESAITESRKNTRHFTATFDDSDSSAIPKVCTPGLLSTSIRHSCPHALDYHLDPGFRQS